MKEGRPRAGGDWANLLSQPTRTEAASSIFSSRRLAFVALAASAVRYTDRCAMSRPTAREHATVPATNLASGLARMPLRRVCWYG